MKFKIESVNISEKKGVAKKPVPLIDCIKDFGIRGDAHAGAVKRQVSFLSADDIDGMRLKSGDFKINHGDFGENVVVRGLDVWQVKIGGKIVIGEVVLEVTQIGKECHSGCAILKAVGECIMPKQGIFTKVLQGGRIHADDFGYYHI